MLTILQWRLKEYGQKKNSLPLSLCRKYWAYMHFITSIQSLRQKSKVFEVVVNIFIIADVSLVTVIFLNILKKYNTPHLINFMPIKCEAYCLGLQRNVVVTAWPSRQMVTQFRWRFSSSLEPRYLLGVAWCNSLKKACYIWWKVLYSFLFSCDYIVLIFYYCLLYYLVLCGSL